MKKYFNLIKKLNFIFKIYLYLFYHILLIKVNFETLRIK